MECIEESAGKFSGLHDFAKSELEKYAKDPVLVSAVKKENARNKTFDQIKEREERWLREPGLTPFIQSMMTSEAGKRLRTIQKEKDYVKELFLVDNQGANVALTAKTTDYWQGDELKFTKSYRSGKGGIYVGINEFDDSSQEYISHISVPIMDGEKAIGVLIFGVIVEDE